MAGVQWAGMKGISRIMVGSIRSFVFEASHPVPTLTDDMTTATGLKNSDIANMTADEIELVGARYGEWVWQHTTAAGLPETQSAMYHSRFLGRSIATFTQDTNAIYNMIQERFANAKRLNTSSSWMAYVKAVAIGFVVGPLLVHYVDELRRKAFGQATQSVISDYVGSIASYVYGGGSASQGFLQSLRYGPAALKTGSLTQTSEDAVIATVGYLVSAISAKNAKAQKEAWTKFAVGASDIFIGYPTGLPINNLYRQGKAAARIIKEF
jgi:hypothetical protein